MNDVIRDALETVYDFLTCHPKKTPWNINHRYYTFEFQLCFIEIDSFKDKTIMCDICQYMIKNKNQIPRTYIFKNEKYRFAKVIGDWLYTRNDLLQLQEFIINQI